MLSPLFTISALDTSFFQFSPVISKEVEERRPPFFCGLRKMAVSSGLYSRGCTLEQSIYDTYLFLSSFLEPLTRYSENFEISCEAKKYTQEIAACETTSDPPKKSLFMALEEIKKIDHNDSYPWTQIKLLHNDAGYRLYALFRLQKYVDPATIKVEFANEINNLDHTHDDSKNVVTFLAKCSRTAKDKAFLGRFGIRDLHFFVCIMIDYQYL